MKNTFAFHLWQGYCKVWVGTFGKLGISQFYLSRLETGSGRVSPDVVSAVVRYFEEPLREIGINVEPWLAISPEIAQVEKPLSQQRPLPLESVSHTRRPATTEELPDGVLHDRPVNKPETK
jgi:hypothetical protein